MSRLRVVNHGEDGAEPPVPAGDAFDAAVTAARAAGATQGLLIWADAEGHVGYRTADAGPVTMRGLLEEARDLFLGRTEQEDE